MAKTNILTRRAALAFTALAAGLAVVGKGNAKHPLEQDGITFMRGYAASPFGQTHYQDVSPANPVGLPLVMIHQAPMSLRQFDTVLIPLAERGVRSIAIDIPGFGQSSPPDFVPSCDDYATVLPGVLGHLGLDRVDLLGHHTGAMVATSAALQFPELINNLVINGPFPMTDEERAGFLDYVERAEKGFVHEHDGTHLQQSFMDRYTFYGEGVDPALITRYTAEKFIGLGPFWYGHHAAFQYDFNAALPKITHRTLLLTNTGDQIYENAKWAREMRPDLAYIELQGGGVDIVDQMPEEWSDAVVGFLRG
jgi:pimeloyl-ACP methyl ester carboxylesterase